MSSGDTLVDMASVCISCLPCSSIAITIISHPLAPLTLRWPYESYRNHVVINIDG